MPGALGTTFEHVGAWTEELRRHGLITHVSVETYHPEIARYGGPAVIAAAEAYFSADSTAVLAQLAARRAKDAPDARAVIAASMVDIATGLLRDRARAMDWLITHTRTDSAAPPRPVHRQAVELVHTHPVGLDEQTAAAWSARRTALADYADALLAAGADPGDLLPDLLHLHHVRMHGPGLPEERTHLHLARAAALSWRARSRRTA